MGFEALKSELENYYQPKRIVIVERFKFYHRKQAETETITQFVAALRKSAEHCEFGNMLDIWLRDMFVCGLSKPSYQKRLLVEKNLTLKTAVQIAEAMESAERDALKLNPSASGTVQKLQARRVLRNQTPGRKSGWKSNPAPRINQPKPNNQNQRYNRERPQRGCFRCCDTRHQAHQCRFANVTCRACGKMGHIAKACRSSQKQNTKFGAANKFEYVHEEPHIQGELFQINPNGRSKGILVSVSINGIPTALELDTGASLSVIGETQWNRMGVAEPVQATHVTLRQYNGEPVDVRGVSMVRVRYGNQSQRLPIYITATNGPGLLGRNWLQYLQLDWGSMFRTSNMVNRNDRLEEGSSSSAICTRLKEDFPQVFGAGLGKWNGPAAKVRVYKGSIPKFLRARPIPFAIRDKVEMKLDDLVKQGALEPISHAEWAAPIVPVRKKGGSIRLCGDFKVTVNPVLQVDRYPLPRIEEVFAPLSGGLEFTVLDMSEAFLQIPIDDESQTLLVINTHKGLFRYKRLPYGVASAPAIQQRRMESLIQGIPNAAVRVDDIIVTGPDQAAHLKNLRRVLERFQESGIKLNIDKCHFFQSQVTYLSHVIDKHGIRPSPENIKAVLEAPDPQNLSDLNALIGMVNYYGRCIPNLATLIAPWNELRRKDKEFNWSHRCKKAFDALKAILSSSTVLVHFNPKLPIILQCDASPVGVGAVISHRMPDGEDRPLAYASRKLTSSEQDYSQMEREGLSLIFGVTRFHQYTFGKKFVLRTDHKPLIYIFGPERGLPVNAAARLQRWAVILQAYDYAIEHVHEKDNGNADGLSRLPTPGIVSPNESDEEAEVHVLCTEGGQSFLDPRIVAQASTQDPIISRATELTHKGWPQKLRPEDRALSPLFARRNELSLMSGCLVIGNKVVVPQKFRKMVLDIRHEGHPGITRMKGLSRESVWWPGIDAQLEAVCKECVGCNQNANLPVQTSRENTWPKSSEPWQRVHLDFAGPIGNKWYLIVVDAGSNCQRWHPLPTQLQVWLFIP